MRILLILFISYVSWVLVNFVTESSSLCFQTFDRNSGPRFCIMICLNFWVDCYVLYLHAWTFGWIVMYFTFTHCHRLMSQWVVMTACHCHAWWR
jgi:hypothetical protein